MAVIVTGAAGHLGSSIVVALGAAGRTVAAVDNDDEALMALAARESAVGAAISADVTFPDMNEALVAEVISQLGPVEACVAAAGIEGPVAPIEELEPGDVEAVFRVNAFATFWLAAAIVPHFKAAGGGRFVPIASGSGRSGSAFTSPYNASKHAVVGLTRSLAKELAPHGIAVNAVCPGYVDSPMADRVIAEQARLTGRRPDPVAAIPVGRMADADEIAAVVTYLVCDAPPSLTGTCVDVDGAMRA